MATSYPQVDATGRDRRDRLLHRSRLTDRSCSGRRRIRRFTGLEYPLSKRECRLEHPVAGRVDQRLEPAAGESGAVVGLETLDPFVVEIVDRRLISISAIERIVFSPED
ncbi:hypothetical protein [Natrinema halophilum]|uniref:Uncharacterized protein n=1 Tax=Natrinema halophilum TaxID=1699371 RepID=A0A7D5K5L8_9EURY|nr:hypothetical protein [Natrinema halophilum]QLG48483.1 hypothetical protein HYG82_06295 [Natrinema halophilum]